MQENYLAKWLNGELTDAEREAFEKSEDYALYARIRDTVCGLEAPEYDEERAFLAVKNRRELGDERVVRLHPFRKFLKVAASAAVIIGACYLYLGSTDESYTTGYAENREIVLPDNSEVILNADSEIAYDTRKWEDQRTLELSGEAFFKVAKGKTFTVKTNAGTITVLGTQFNVEQRKDFFEVTCFEGLVKVLFGNKETKLSAGNSLVAIDGTVRDLQTSSASEPSWMHDESSFKSVPLKFVLDEFERQHDKKVETKNIDLDQLFTGSFSNSDTELALQSISRPSQIKFKFEGDKVLFYGEKVP